MNESIFKVIELAITFLTGFFLARYQFSKSRPLAQMEIAYNRIYYPMHKWYRSKRYEESLPSFDFAQILLMVEPIILKYNKHAALTTIRAIERLKKSIEKNESRRIVKDNYMLLKTDILGKSKVLRYNLGYVDGNLISSYFLLDEKDRYTVHLMILGALIYITTIFYGISESNPGFLQFVNYNVILGVLLCLMVIQLIIIFVKMIIRLIKKYWIKLLFTGLALIILIIVLMHLKVK